MNCKNVEDESDMALNLKLENLFRSRFFFYRPLPSFLFLHSILFSSSSPLFSFLPHLLSLLSTSLSLLSTCNLTLPCRRITSLASCHPHPLMSCSRNPSALFLSLPFSPLFLSLCVCVFVCITLIDSIPLSLHLSLSLSLSFFLCSSFPLSFSLYLIFSQIPRSISELDKKIFKADFKVP